MKLKTRTTNTFVEVSVDEIKATLWEGGAEVDDTIINLLDVVDDLLNYTQRRFDYQIEDLKRN